jgi:hypothetical protein
MNNKHLKLLSVFLGMLLLTQLSTCRTSEFKDIFLRCAPECFIYKSPVPLVEIKNAFEQVIGTIDVSNADLTGRWVMLAVKRYVVNKEDEKVVSDLLYSKTMLFNQSEGSVTVSDCFQQETYLLNETGFTIPQNSVFFSGLYFENKEDIQVSINNNIRLDAIWTLISLQNTEVSLEIAMFKVSDDSGVVELGNLEDPLGQDTDINCYSHLHLFSTGEKKFGDQWVPFQGEVKELLLKLNDFDDLNVALAFNTLAGQDDYAIVFNLGIENWEYRCLGFNNYAYTKDLLSFEGSFTIDAADVDCLSKSLGEYPFNFSAL